MAEIDTKPFESVQASLSLFEQKTDQNKCSSSSKAEVKEKKLDILLKELADCKLQLQVKESSEMQAIIELEVYRNTIEELSTQLKNAAAERDKYAAEYFEAQHYKAKLEYGRQILESENQKDYLCIVDECKTLKEELILMKTELAAAKESNYTALKQVGSMKREKKKTKELVIYISELNEAILSSSLKAIEAEEKRSAFFQGMEAELQVASEAVIQFHEKLHMMKRQLDIMDGLENEVLDKMIQVDYYQSELKQVKEFYVSSLRIASDVIDNLAQLHLEIEMKEKENCEQAAHIVTLKDDVKRMKEELQSAREKITDLNSQIEVLTSKVQDVSDEVSETMKRELELQVEIATLKSELHKSRARIAAAEAAEARYMSSQAGLYLAVQQIAVEAEIAKNETQRLKLLRNDTEAEVEIDGGEPIINGEGIDLVSGPTSSCSVIKISREEYESLIQKSEKSDEVIYLPFEDESELLGNKMEVDKLKEELEAANAEISELRIYLEATTRRAELAEKAKAAIEDQLRNRRKEEQMQRRANSELLREHSAKRSENMIYDKPSASQPPGSNSGGSSLTPYAERSDSVGGRKHFSYVPLGKILNMKL
ncbi:uncharacterized protein [Typha angustifolia]|uniref:uncharacterized protein n=1 Tax=Typha angustifolia TaxID=59011 RepID=UPI003C2CE63D